MKNGLLAIESSRYAQNLSAGIPVIGYTNRSFLQKKVR
jgi:hypothetical protein